MSVPTIFSKARRSAREARALQRRPRADHAAFLWEEMVEDTLERLAFVRAEPSRALLIGPGIAPLAEVLTTRGTEVECGDSTALDAPLGCDGFDLIVTLGALDAVNDLPGALIHMRNALAPGGMVMASFIGGQSLPALRAAMLAADGERPAARLHPMVDPRAAPGLLARAGWSDPVVDSHVLTARYPTLARLISDLRDHGLTSALADTAPPLGKAALARAQAGFADRAETDGKVSEIFEIITLTGRRSLAGT